MQWKTALIVRFFRFLCNHNGKMEKNKYTHLFFVARSSPGVVSYALRCSARDNCNSLHPVLHFRERNFYMGDLYITANFKNPINNMNSIRECLAVVRFNLTKLKSNFDKFFKQVANEYIFEILSAITSTSKSFGVTMERSHWRKLY